MIPANEFSDYYKTISDAELLNILDNPGAYQDAAIEAARKEFSDRRLSEEKIQYARQILTVKQEAEGKTYDQIRSIKEKGDLFASSFNPMQSGISKTEKTIRIIVLAFGGIFIYTCVTEYRMILGSLLDFPEFPFYSFTVLAFPLLLGAATFFFSIRQKTGWILLTAFNTLGAITNIFILIRPNTWQASIAAIGRNIYGQPNPLTFVLYLIIFGGALYTLCKQDIRDAYSINRDVMGLTIGIAGFIGLIIRMVFL